MKFVKRAFVIIAYVGTATFGPNLLAEQMQSSKEAFAEKPLIYQIFTRLYGNKVGTNVPWGTIEENGVGKFNDINEQALNALKDLGVNYVWYTGVLHHAVVNDYPELGLVSDDADVVKGRAGSPYAIKDYYSVNPDLATDVTRRLEEFDALVQRTHSAGLKVIVDIVPNHVARNYVSLNPPDGTIDFGANDDTSLEYARENNFYYVPGQSFVVPSSPDYAVLGGRAPDAVDGTFDESPAKWTGNGARSPEPNIGDWYETVKINFGVRPDGRFDFDTLPASYNSRTVDEVVAYWNARSVPQSWQQFLAIAEFWLERGVDGFRFDMAQMVPVEFWSYLNSNIKAQYPETLLLAEIYEPHRYRDYLYRGRMDYLYSKMEIYDALRAVMEGKNGVGRIREAYESHSDIDSYMLYFLENHDEQRIASQAFMGSGEAGLPGALTAILLGRGPIMLYFAQELGEASDEDAGFGKASRTTIFDYWGVPTHQRWMNNGLFDGGQSTASELGLRRVYRQAIELLKQHDLSNWDTQFVSALDVDGGDKVLAFKRCGLEQCLLVLANFATTHVDLSLSESIRTLISGASQVLNSISDPSAPTLEGPILNLPSQSVSVWLTEH